eukprot:SAG31_NODE_4595_length_3106_cov_4.715996_1_plen_422_part_00
MLISPLVQKGAVHQHPRCSSRHKEGPFDGVCRDGGRSAGSDHGGAQFEHASLPATVKSLFNLVRAHQTLLTHVIATCRQFCAGVQSHFLTERDAWAGDLSELLTEPSPRTDTPLHFPDAHPPQKPFLPPFPIPGTPPPPPPAGWWRAFGPPFCNATPVAVGSISDHGDTADDGAVVATPPPLVCAPFIEGNLCDDHDHMIGAAGKGTHTIAECFAWCNATAGCQVLPTVRYRQLFSYDSINARLTIVVCPKFSVLVCTIMMQYFGFGSTGWCIRYAGSCTPRQSPDPRYNVYRMTHRTSGVATAEAIDTRRRLRAAEVALPLPTGVPKHCSARERGETTTCNSRGGDCDHHCTAWRGGGPNNKQRNQMAVLAALNGQALLANDDMAEMSQADASAFIEQQWVTYMGTSSGHEEVLAAGTTP